jgi:hypothetical protein
MPIIGDKKKAMAAILSKIGADGQRREAEAQPESGEPDVYSSLAEDFHAASRENSVQGMAAVFKKFHGMMSGPDEGQE